MNELFDAALPLSWQRRREFLRQACPDDPELRKEVEDLLHYAGDESFLEEPPIAEARANALAPGKRLGSFEILGLLGKGGMGEVYRARDLRLEREVAIKILPPDLAHNAERALRFEREARAASALNHPNILSVHDIGREGGLSWMVCELVEGQSLRQLLTGRPLPLGTAVDIAAQIADALAAAHTAGVVHRDLKPENVMLTRDERVKILDFGLAKWNPPGASGPSDVPSETGTIVGTPYAMSPEQVLGSPVDNRSDIFSLGTLFFEMLAGKPPFAGGNSAAVMNTIVHGDPEDLPATVPDTVASIVHRCLAKAPERRFQSAADLAFALRLAGGRNIDGTTAPKPTHRRWWITAAAALMLALAAAAGWLYRQGRPTTASPTAGNLRRLTWYEGLTTEPPALPPAQRFLIHPMGSSGFLGTGVLSPDGRRMVMVVTTSGQLTRMWIRELNSTEFQVLPYTENGRNPFWSPDSRTVGFFAGGRLKTIELSGMPPRDLCAAEEGRGGTWNSEGTILFAPDTRNVIHRIPATGGTPAPVTTLDAKSEEESHRWPFFLPDGRHFVYLASGHRMEQRVIVVGSLDTGRIGVLASAAVAPAFALPNALFYVRGGSLLVQALNLRTLRPEGAPRLVAGHIAYMQGRGEAAYSVSNNGHLAYSGAPRTDTQLLWFDRAGKNLGPLGTVGQYRCPELSPDEKTVAVEAMDAQRGEFDILMIRVADGRTSCLTDDLSEDSNVAWSHDGQRLAFTSNRRGVRDIYVASLAERREEIVLQTTEEKALDQWSEDGQYLLYSVTTPKTLNDLWAFRLSGGKRPFPLLNSPANEVQGRISPSGRWIAYASNESGRLEVYVLSFPNPGGKMKVSTAGGTQPIWSHDGKELFFLTPDRKLMSVAVEDGERPRLGSPRYLFQTHVSGLTNARNHYTVTRDGRRFLVNTLVEDDPARPITVVLNWASETASYRPNP